MTYLKKKGKTCGEASGLEWVVLKNLPMVVLGGTLIPLFISVFNRLLPPQGPAHQIAEHVTTVDIFAIATALTVWMTALALGIGCAIIVLMKGPAYIADEYPLRESPQPIGDRNRAEL